MNTQFDFSEAMSRRALLQNGTMLGLFSAFPWAESVLAHQPDAKNPPILSFKRTQKGEGLIGLYGEVQIFNVGDEVLPAFMRTSDGSAVMDITGRSPFVRYGNGDNAIEIRSEGVRFGKISMKWSAATIKKLINDLSNDPQKIRGVLQLRSNLHITYPVALREFKKKTKGKKMAQAMKKSSSGLGARSMNCTTTTITETVIRYVTETIAVIKTAEQQYQDCYDRLVQSEECKDSLLPTGLCAAGKCALNVFINLLVGFIDIVTAIAEEVTRTVMTCTLSKLPEWPNPFELIERGNTFFRGVLPQASPQFDTKTISDALSLLKNISGFLGPLTCLLNGQWSLERLETPLIIGGRNIALPYGVSVCISSECARQLALENTWNTLRGSWSTALGALAGLSTTAAGYLTAISITATPGVAAFATAAPEIVVAAAALILAAIILMLIWVTTISAELSFHELLGSFDDGRVCIQHPTFALALVKLFTLGQVPLELIPPIVTG